MGGREVTFWFELIIGFLCSPTGTLDMTTLNPYLKDPSVRAAAAVFGTTHHTQGLAVTAEGLD